MPMRRKVIVLIYREEPKPQFKCRTHVPMCCSLGSRAPNLFIVLFLYICDTCTYKVHDKIEKLQTELEWIECFLEDADNRQHQEKLVRKWVAQITNFAYKAEDIIERYVHEVSHHRQDGIWNTIKWSFKLLCACHVYALHNLGVDIDELIVEVSDLNKRLRRYGVQFTRPMESLAYNNMMREERRTYSHVEDVVVGLEKDVQLVVAELMKEQVKVISICGMGGLGKSTLARRVFVDKDVKEHFSNNCVWVYVSKEFGKRSVFEEILIGLSVTGKNEDEREKIKNLTDEELPKKIYELLRNKKCFVVLDDIWNNEDWDNLEPALGSIRSTCTSKILLSTRNRELLEYVDSSGYPHYLEPLDDENSWKLLQLKAFSQKWGPGNEEATSSEDTTIRIVTTTSDVEEKITMEKLGREMLKHCHGLPLAIIALGGILRSKRTPLEWEEVLKNISAYLMVNTDKSGGILPVLELSYHDLPFYLKPCFLYLGNFPQGHEISTQRLYHLWEAEGILTKDETEGEGVTSYEIGERLMLGLIQRSMVQVVKRWPSGRIKTCRVHDLMREMCIRKCRETSFLDVLDFSILNGASNFADRCMVRKQIHRCAFHGKAKGVAESSSSSQHGQIKASCVRSVMVFQFESRVNIHTESFKKIVKSFPLLRVLHLWDGMSYRSVVGVEQLIHLRYLSLRVGSFKMLSLQFWDLKNVITLDLRRCDDMKFPNKFHQMERLRHLYLPSLFKVKGGMRLTFKVDKMETLKNFNPEICELKDLLQMTSLRVFFICNWYCFRSKDELKLLAESPIMKSGHLVNSVRLRIKAGVVDEDPTILGSLFKGNPCFTKLRLTGESGEESCDNIEDAIARGIQVFPLGLTKLHISQCKLGRNVRLALEKLPCLQMLRLRWVDMGNKLSFSAGSFPQLNVFDLFLPKELEEWEVGDGALLSLQRLHIYGCDKLKKLPDGLPHTVNITCYNPCIKGIEKYNTCEYYKPADSVEINQQLPPLPAPSSPVPGPAN